MPSAKGTKKKPVAEPVLAPAVPAPEPAPAPAPAPAPIPAPVPVAETPKKKGKKAPKVVAVVTPNGIEGSFLPEPRRPLIAHLQVNSSEVKFNDTDFFLYYDPKPPGQPEPYDAMVDNVFVQQNEPILDKIVVANVEEERAPSPPIEQESAQTKTHSVGLDAFTKCDLMVEYRALRTTKKIPEKTNVACFWCAHSFDWQPCIIPEREEKGIYRVYGNFCSPSCAMAFVLNEALDTHVRWERIALLHRLYGKYYTNRRIFPSPARESLKLFGGPMDIESYRATIGAGKVRIDLQIPPMVSILGSIDTKPIDFYDSSMKHTISPLLGEIVPKAEEGLRLKRSKPLKEKYSTLDSVLKIQIKGAM
jgi:hypothetical protein